MKTSLFTLVLLGAVVFAKKDKKKDKDVDMDAKIDDILVDESKAFAKYAAKHNKFYTTAADFEMRKDCWKKSHTKVRELNSKH
jgi:hypothetical protein